MVFIKIEMRARYKVRKETKFSFSTREPESGARVSLLWRDGSNCECIYTGLDKTILPLPTHWSYVGVKQKKRILKTNKNNKK